jgi:uncharacterized protein
LHRYATKYNKSDKKMTLIICVVAFIASLLTLLSGFGLGTILLPVFALFFPLPVAIAATAVVHLLNNLFKVYLVGNDTDWETFLRFAVPASFAAVLGALLLKPLEGVGSLAKYRFGQRTFEITAINLTIGILIIVFAMMELLPQFKKLSFPPKYMPLGGFLSGFFGGISGIQGALRSAFLIRAGLNKEKFIGTGVLAAVVVDISRLLTYSLTFYSAKLSIVKDEMWSIISFATLSAFFGAYLGKRLIKKVTIGTVQKIVGIMLIIMGFALAVGMA